MFRLASRSPHLTAFDPPKGTDVECPLFWTDLFGAAIMSLLWGPRGQILALSRSHDPFFITSTAGPTMMSLVCVCVLQQILPSPAFAR